MHQHSSVAHQSMKIIGLSSLRCSNGLVGSTGRPDCDGFPFRTSSLLVGAGESDDLARPGERASVAGLGWAGNHRLLLHTWTLPRATAPQTQK